MQIERLKRRNLQIPAACKLSRACFHRPPQSSKLTGNLKLNKGWIELKDSWKKSGKRSNLYCRNYKEQSLAGNEVAAKTKIKILRNLLKTMKNDYPKFHKRTPRTLLKICSEEFWWLQWRIERVFIGWKFRVFLLGRILVWVGFDFFF